MQYTININVFELRKALLLMFAAYTDIVKVSTIDKIIDNFIKEINKWNDSVNVENLDKDHLLDELSRGLEVSIYHQVSEELFSTFTLEIFALSVIMEYVTLNHKSHIGVYLTEKSINEVKVNIISLPN